MNVIILAGGLGTRFEDLNVFPKVLLPTPTHDSILSAHCSIFAGHDIYLVINQKYLLMVQDYCKANNLEHVNIISTTDSNGSYNTIRSVQHKLPKSQRLFVWSDLEINYINLEDLTCNTVFTKNGEYRFHFDDKMEYSCDNGNVPGVYYLHDEYWFQYITDNYDLADWIKDTGVFCDKRPVELVEYRDKYIYTKAMVSAKGDVEKSRFFNSVTIDKTLGIVKKSVNHPDYIPLMAREICWYHKLKELGIEDIAPKLLNCYGTYMELEYLDGYIPLYQAIKSSIDKELLFDGLYKVLAKMHQYTVEVPYEQFVRDLKKEVIDKTVDRCNKIRHMLINYNENELIDLLYKVYDWILIQNKSSKGTVKYVFGHADINGSNCMIHPYTLDVKLIDPRAYFGSSTMYIFEPYETAKILYCLSGYDEFNINPQVWNATYPHQIGPIDFEGFESKLLLAVIWISLAGYISQDIMKANIAYEHGLNMLKNIFTPKICL